MAAQAMARLSEALSGRYSIERKLGAGGVAAVYVADDPRNGRRKVAIKVLRPELAAVVGAERFAAEIATTEDRQTPAHLAAASLSHNIGIGYITS